jgi:hypothetical protein
MVGSDHERGRVFDLPWLQGLVVMRDLVELVARLHATPGMRRGRVHGLRHELLVHGDSKPHW